MKEPTKTPIEHFMSAQRCLQDAITGLIKAKLLETDVSLAISKASSELQAGISKLEVQLNKSGGKNGRDNQ